MLRRLSEFLTTGLEWSGVAGDTIVAASPDAARLLEALRRYEAPTVDKTNWIVGREDS